MRKLFLAFCFLLFLGLAWPVEGLAFWENLPKPAGFKEKPDKEQTLGIFSDTGFSQATNQFSPGQTVYVRVEAQGSGDKEKTLRVLDAGKDEVERMSLDQSGTGPYVFTASFAAPNAAGVYYVDIKLDSGQGSVYSAQANINVGDSGRSASVSSEAEGVALEFSLPEASSSLEATPTGREAASEAAKSRSTGLFSIVRFLKKAFLQFLSLLSGIF